MFDVALSSAGATIALATSYDENYPPENIIDGYVLCIIYMLVSFCNRLIISRFFWAFYVS